MDGWYYLHTNGDLIFKRNLDGTATDIRESDFAVGMWPCDHTDRESAWTICVEALAGGANAGRIKELAAKWGLSDSDAQIYAGRIGAKLQPMEPGESLHGERWRATACRSESPAGIGITALDALASLAKVLGYRPMKMWGATFKDLLRVAA